MTSFTLTPPLRTAEQAARDFLARADELANQIAVMEADDSMFANPEKVAQWRAACAEKARCEGAVETLGFVHLFNDGPGEGRAA